MLETRHPVALALVTLAMVAGAAGTTLAATMDAPTLVKRTLSTEGAQQVVAFAAAEARRLGAGGAIAVVDDGGAVLVVERLEGTFPAAWSVSVGKARTAAQFRKPTSAFEDAIKGGRVSLTAVNEMVPLEGGVPLVVDGQVVGAIGVSGAMNADQDNAIANAAADAFAQGKLAATAAMATPGPAVSYFPADSVSASFARGGVLLREGNYMIHTSRRVEPGKVEVHTLDTDLIYVQRGSARFVTGGTLADGAEIAPDEIRGTKLDGGTTRTLAPGDVIVVPHGVPHWFQSVSGEFRYYTIKVR